jgi:23S rRNA (uracil-5-)-methyltransferase RumA
MNNKELRKTLLAAIQSAPVGEPLCPHAHDCGGCAFQDRLYAAQVEAKAAMLRTIWRDADLPASVQVPDTRIAMLASPSPFGYRTRMDYVATKGRFGLRRSGRFNYIVELDTCRIIPPAGFAAAKAVWLQSRELGLPDYNIRSHEGFLRYVVVRRSPDNQFLLAAVTAAGSYEQHMAQMAEQALQRDDVLSFHWLINATKTDLSFGDVYRHWGAATLPMRVGDRTLQIGPNTFFQNNVHLLLPLLEAAAAAVCAGGTPATVADLYGGVGTIALHLAARVGRLVCVESVSESVALARRNISDNRVANVQAVEAAVDAFLPAQPVGSFEVVVADPPRTGLGPEVCRELLRIAPGRIVYISCNPLSQAEDLRMLAPDYRLRSLQGFDMFPHTPHMEALAVLDCATQ